MHPLMSLGRWGFTCKSSCFTFKLVPVLTHTAYLYVFIVTFKHFSSVEKRKLPGSFPWFGPDVSKYLLTLTCILANIYMTAADGITLSGWWTYFSRIGPHLDIFPIWPSLPPYLRIKSLSSGKFTLTVLTKRLMLAQILTLLLILAWHLGWQLHERQTFDLLLPALPYCVPKSYAYFSMLPFNKVNAIHLFCAALILER